MDDNVPLSSTLERLNLRHFILSQYGRSLHPFTLDVNTLWTSSSLSMHETAVGLQRGQQYHSLDLDRVSIVSLERS